MSILQSSLGICVFISLAFLLSENRRGQSIKAILIALSLQLSIALVFFFTPFVFEALLYLNKAVVALDSASKAGASYMFGYLGGAPLPFEEISPGASFIIFFQVLPIILLISALSSLLFYFGILQKLIHLISIALEKTLKADPVTAFGVASSVFLGIIETPLLIKPYLKKASRSSLFTILTAATSTVAGTVMVLYSNILQSVLSNPVGHIITASLMSAPAAILLAKIMIPGETEATTSKVSITSPHSSAAEAIIEGTNEGVQMIISIAAIIIVLFSLVELANMSLGFFGIMGLEKLAAYFMAPFCWLMGVPANEILLAGELMATKTILNEFVAYLNMAQLEAGSISEPTKLILTYSMCGFANLASLGILIGGLGAILPERKKEIVNLAGKSLISGTLATMMTGAFVNIVSQIT